MNGDEFLQFAPRRASSLDADASRERDRSFHPPLQGEGRAPQVRGVGCAAMQGVAARLRALSPHPAALRASTFPLQGKVEDLRFDQCHARLTYGLWEQARQ